MSFARVMMLGIASLHSQKIVHTDLKPDNLLLIPNPHLKDDFLLRIIDMDWAIFSDRRAPWHGEIGYIGTPGYQSPEHLRGDVPTEASDVFTCGVILSELLAGRHPYAGRGEYERAVLASNFTPFRSDQEIARVPSMPALEALITRCFELDPTARPTSVEIKDGLRGKPVAATPSLRPSPPLVAPHATEAAGGPSRKAVSGGLTLRLRDQVVLACNIDTAVGRSHLKRYSSDAEFLSQPQFRVYRQSGEWMIEHLSTATNQTLLDGRPLTGSQRLADGMRISVGNAAKGIEKLPLVVRIQTEG